MLGTPRAARIASTMFCSIVTSTDAPPGGLIKPAGIETVDVNRLLAEIDR